LAAQVFLKSENNTYEVLQALMYFSMLMIKKVYLSKAFCNE